MRKRVQNQFHTIGDTQLVVDSQERLFERVLLDARLMSDLATAAARSVLTGSGKFTYLAFSDLGSS